jgi:hypothetical protein
VSARGCLFGTFTSAEAHPGGSFLSSVFAHVSVPTQLLTRARLPWQPSEEWLDGAVAIRAMTSLVVTRPMQLSGLGAVTAAQVR